jgi:serine phosphatase RsbU (regulator of sigma subunit)
MTLASARPPSDPSEPGLARIRLLTEVASSLSAAASVEAIMRALAGAFVPQVCDGFEVILRMPNDTLRRIVMGLEELPGWQAREGVPVPEQPDHPVRMAIATGEVQVISADDPEQAHLLGSPDIPTSAAAFGIRRAIIAPMSGRASMKGAVAAGLGPSERDWHEVDIELVSSVARLAGLALENLEALEQEARTAALLERAAAVGLAMATLSTEEEIANAAASLAREELGASAGFVYLVDEEAGDRFRLRLAGYSGYDEVALDRWEVVDPSAELPSSEAFRTGQPVTVCSRSELDSRYPALSAGMQDREIALVCAPILSGSEAVGVVCWGFSEARRLGEAESRFAQVVAEQCAAALIRARAEADRELATEQLSMQADELRAVATTLQSSMLPPSLPSIPGVELVAYHWPGGVGVEVSGDFYDVLPLGDGRWGLLMGDVCGKGVEAAVVSSLARHTARAAALHIEDPADVLRWVHDALAAERQGRFCTVAYGVLTIGDAGAGGDAVGAVAGGVGASLALALGGHPQPIVVGADGPVQVGTPGSLLGAFDPLVSRTDVGLLPGDLLVLYTDGVTDAPQGESLTEAEFLDLLASNRDRDLHELASLVRRALDERRPVEYDDTALMLLRIGGG